MAASVLAQILENVKSGALLPLEKCVCSSADVDRVATSVMIEVEKSLDAAVDRALELAHGTITSDVARASFREALLGILGTSALGVDPASAADARELQEIEELVSTHSPFQSSADQSKASEVLLNDIQNMIELLK